MAIARDDLPTPFLVRHDDVDWDIFDFLRSRVPSAKMIRTERLVFPQVEEFLFEAFALFYKQEPELVPEEERPQGTQFRGKLLEYLIQTPAYYAAVAETSLDEFFALHASIRVTTELLKFLRKMGGLAGIAGMTASQLGDVLAEAFANAMRGAREEQAEFDRWARGWGTHPGQLRELPVEEKFALMEKLQRVKQLRQISALAGRAVEILQHKRGERIPLEHGEVSGVTVGDDLADVLPEELVLRQRPRLRRIFRIRFAERALAVVEFRPRVALGRGPLIVCVDTSGSMQIDFRETWAKAVACALFTQAQQDQRTFAYMHFSSEYDLRKQIVRRGEFTLDQLIDLATYAYSGGTDFDRPLTEALTLVESEPDLRRADIVFISDGECGVSPHVQERIAAVKEKLGLSVIGVLVQEGVDRAQVEARVRAARDRLRAQGQAREGNPSRPPLSRAFRARFGVFDGDGDPVDVMLSFCDHLYPVTELTAEAIAGFGTSVINV